MEIPSRSFTNAIENISRLPTIGRKTAFRLALHIMKKDPEYAHSLGEAIKSLKNDISYCRKCYNISDAEICAFCNDKKRAIGKICVVEDIPDVYAIENTGNFKGQYHVLGGLISPMDGVSPEDLNISSLTERLKHDEISEIIFALNSGMEGETTCFYLNKILKTEQLTITTLSKGVAIGEELQYVDEITLANSIENRTIF